MSTQPEIQSSKPLSTRTRFEIFKRDDFTCNYCGRKSPEVVLECDHIIPICEGGSSDPINLITACWECNRGKGGVPLNEVMTGEDPHDRAILILERERQLAEYNRVLANERQEREITTWDLVYYWLNEQGLLTPEQKAYQASLEINKSDYRWLFAALKWCPAEQIRTFMDIAIGRHMTKGFRYVAGCARIWRYEMQATKDMRDQKTDDPYADS